MQRLMNYPWPGNIRELQNLLARAVVLSSGPVLRLGGGLSASRVQPPRGLGPSSLTGGNAGRVRS